jgi:hypothetical protein
VPRGLSRAEQETVITRTADEKEWLVYTCDPAMKRRLVKLTKTLGLSLSIVDEWGVEVRLPVSCVRFQVPQRLSAQEIDRRREQGRRLGAATAARRCGAKENGCEKAAG